MMPGSAQNNPDRTSPQPESEDSSMTNIRIDVGRAFQNRGEPPALPDAVDVRLHPERFAPDGILISCRECGRNHLVGLECPDADAPLIQGPNGIMVVEEDDSLIAVAE
jgi:hypothetical protein